MIPQDIDTGALADDLADDSVAFTPAAPRDEHLAEQLSELVDAGVGVIVSGPGSGADMRDVAQAVLDQSEFSTVIVRGPTAVAAVSEELTRAQIESGEAALIAEPDYVVGVEEFLAVASALEIPWGGVALGFVVAVALIVSASLAAVRTVKH